MKLGIRFKIIGFVSILLTIVIFLLSFFVLNGIKKHQKSELEDLLINQKDVFETYLDEQYMKVQYKNNEKIILSDFSSLIYEKFYSDSMPIQLYDLTGKPYINIYKKSYENSKTPEIISYLKKDKIVYKKENNMVYFFSPLKHNKKNVAFVEIDYDNYKKVSFYNEIRNLFIAIGFIALIIGILLGIIYFLKITNCILKLKEYVSCIEGGKFHKVEIINRSDELGDLSKGIKYMSSSIEKNINNLNAERNNLKLAVEKLNKLTIEQKSFIGSVTHEFKTPISVIKAYGDLLEIYEDDTELIKDAAHNICFQSKKLKDMVDNILNLSSVEKYDFELNVKEINLKEVIESIVSTLKLKASKNLVTINSELNNITLKADLEFIRHIFINILDNAIKYNKEGGQVILSSSEYDDYYIIEIKDSGIGICENNLEKIFEPFYRVDKEGINSPKGTGLGLALVKKLVEKHKGELWAKSTLGVGSTFYVKLMKNP